MGWTNEGLYTVLASFFRGASAPASFYAALVTGDPAPTADTATLGELTQIAVGSGYSDGGVPVARSVLGFDVLTRDDVADRAFIQLADVAFAAAGGAVPLSGSGARYVVLTDDAPVVANRAVLAWFDLQSVITLDDGQTLKVADAQLELAQPGV